MHEGPTDHTLEFIDSWLKLRYELEDIPGLGVAIVQDGKTIFNEAYGYADVVSGEPLTRQHVFRAASHGKAPTATAVMQLQEAEKLSIDDPVAKYLPWLKGHTDSNWRQATVSQLLCHGAGVIRDGSDANYWGLDRPFPTKPELQSEVMESKLFFLPADNVMKYSNVGYGILGQLVETVAGQSYGSYVTENILQPLNLEHTYPDYSVSINEPFVTGHTRREEKGASRLPITPRIKTDALAAATGTCATLEDLARFFANIQDETDETVLKKASKLEMRQAQLPVFSSTGEAVSDYGFGLRLSKSGKHLIHGHGGLFAGQGTQTIVDPCNNISISAGINTFHATPSMLAMGVHDAICLLQSPSADLRRFEGIYASLFHIKQLVAVDDHTMLVFEPDTWLPLRSAERLEHVGGDTLRIVKASSFEALRELVRFSFKNGQVVSVDYAGTTKLPWAVWREKQRNRRFIGPAS